MEQILRFAQSSSSLYVSKQMALKVIDFLILNGGQVHPSLVWGLNPRLEFKNNYIHLDGPLLELYEQQYHHPMSGATQIYRGSQALSKNQK